MELTENQSMVHEVARRFALERIAPIAAELDESGVFPRRPSRSWARWASSG